VRDDLKIDPEEIVACSAALRFGAIARYDGVFVVRHRAWLDGLTPERLDRSIFGVALDSFQLSAACAHGGTNAEAIGAFGHLFT